MKRREVGEVFEESIGQINELGRQTMSLMLGEALLAGCLA